MYCRAVGKEATTQLSSKPAPSPPSALSPLIEVSAKSTTGRGKKNKSKNKSRSALQPTAPLGTVKPPLVSWTPPAPKRSATPSPTISSSSQRSQTPPLSANVPPPQPSLPVPTLKVVTTKEETRLFKPKPNNKKTKSKLTPTAPSTNEDTKQQHAAKAAPVQSVTPVLPVVTTTPSPSILVVASSPPVPAPQPTTTTTDEPSEKRGRSSSVPSNNRNKANVTPTVQKSKNHPPPPPQPPKSSATPPVIVPTTTTSVATVVEAPKKMTETAATTATVTTTTTSTAATPVASVWQPRTHNKSLVKAPVTPLLQQTTNRPQPPVGKILPEVRRVAEEHPVLPKPIGYRHVREKASPPPPPTCSTWNTEPNQPWYSLTTPTSPPSAPSGAWWPDGSSNPLHYLESSPDCWFGLPRLTSDYTESASIGSSMWPASSTNPSGGPATPDVWPEVQPSPPSPLLQTLNNTTPVSRVYSPWSVPHWFDITQTRQQQQRQSQDPLLHLNPPNVVSTSNQLLQNNSLWDSSATRNNNNSSPPSNESWPSYSQF